MSLNHATTSDHYAPGATDSGPFASVTVLVFGQPVLAQLGVGNPPYFDGSLENELPNGAAVTYDQPCDGIRFRSARAGQPGQVTTLPSYR